MDWSLSCLGREVQRVTLEELFHNPEELLDFSNLYMCKSGRYVPSILGHLKVFLFGEDKMKYKLLHQAALTIKVREL